MELITAKTAGFCFGVNRAIDTVYEEVSKSDSIYTFGPIIHNEEVVNDLQRKGVKVLEPIEEICKLSQGTVIIRSHGISKKVYDQISANDRIRIVDCTCPFVQRIHKIVNEASRNNRDVIIVGDQGHPEVEGIKGWADGACYIINNKQDAENLILESKRKITIVAQTTYNEKKFQEIVDIFTKKEYDTTVVNTICSATHERQLEAYEIAGKVDSMIVIGSQSSSNSKKLFEICKQKCEDTIFIQTVNDLGGKIKGDAKTIGITAGASTPKNIIEEVQSYVRGNDI